MPVKDSSFRRRNFLKLFGYGMLGTATASSLLLGCNGCEEKILKPVVLGFVDWMAEIPDLINQYRKANKLPAIKLSSKLSAVALAHVKDLTNYQPEKACGDKGNLHSWSNHGNWKGVNGNGAWKGCCFPKDFSNSICMWDKPKEIAKYPSEGYEISTLAYDGKTALSNWKASSDHNDVILNKGIWTNYTWKALGGVYLGGYACAWFGVTAD